MTGANERIYGDAWGTVTANRSMHDALGPWCTGVVVEVGPGTSPHSPVADTLYVEPIPAAVERLLESGRRAVVGRMEQLPVEDASVHALLAFDVLEHCEDDVAALAEAARVLRAGGHLIVAVPLGPAYFSPLDVLVGHTFRYDPAVLIERIEGAGFTVVAGRVWDPRWPWVKHFADRLQWAGVMLVGLRRALALRAAWVRWGWSPRVRLGDVAFGPQASRALLISERLAEHPRMLDRPESIRAETLSRVSVPRTQLSVDVPTGRRPVALEWGLAFVIDGEDTRLVGSEVYKPTRQGALSILPCEARGAREAAEAWCSKLQGRPDINDSARLPGAVEFEWTDGVRRFRTWYFAFAGQILEVDFWTFDQDELELGPDEVELTVLTLLRSLSES